MPCNECNRNVQAMFLDLAPWVRLRKVSSLATKSGSLVAATMFWKSTVIKVVFYPVRSLQHLIQLPDSTKFNAHSDENGQAKINREYILHFLHSTKHFVYRVCITRRNNKGMSISFRIFRIPKALNLYYRKTRLSSWMWHRILWWVLMAVIMKVIIFWDIKGKKVKLSL
jgi:hypothetical protein